MKIPAWRLAVTAILLSPLAVLVWALSVAPKTPPSLPSLNAADAQIGDSLAGLPPLSYLNVAYSSPIAYRRYVGAIGGGVAVLVHGSSGHSIEMHSLARALAQAGVTVYAIDVRGHGGTGRNGDIDYRGELEDDLSALRDRIAAEHPGAPVALVGHSLGGGFILRIASEPLAKRFSGFVAISPFLGSTFPAARPQNGGWADVATPRIIALSILDQLNIDQLDGLPVIAYAVDPKAAGVRTRSYSWRLLSNYSPPRDWRPALARIDRPTEILVGSDDELFDATAYGPAIHAANPKIPVRILPGVSHMGAVLAPGALAVEVETVKRLLHGA